MAGASDDLADIIKGVFHISAKVTDIAVDVAEIRSLLAEDDDDESEEDT
jgi:hypothetical protein